MFGLTSKSRIDRLEKELVEARAAAVKAAEALEVARDGTISAVAGGEAKAVASARTKEASARGAAENATSAVDDIAKALGRVREEEQALATDAEIAEDLAILKASSEKGEKDLADGARRAAEGLVMIGRAFVEQGLAAEAWARLQKRGVAGPFATSLDSRTVEDTIAKALDTTYPNRHPVAVWREELTIDLRPFQTVE